MEVISVTVHFTFLEGETAPAAPVAMTEPIVGDAFGDLLTRCWEAGGAAGVAHEIVERDDGYISVDDAARYFGGADSWSPHEAAIMSHARGRVLDIGCGAGRQMMVLREQGLQVQGVDPSPGAVAVCRQRGLDAALGDLDRLPAGPFDTLLLFGGNLALLGSPAAAAGRLAALATVAAPGARILCSAIDPHRIANPIHVGYHNRNVERGRPAGQLRLRVRCANTATAWFDYWFTGVEESGEVLAGSRWRVDVVERGAEPDPMYAAVLVLR
jgi:SAM-dependent methyltransferase